MPPGTTPAPDRNTKKPSFVPPPKTCDAHCHIFGPADKFPYDPNASYHPPDSGFEVEIRGDEYLILRERDVHAVASEDSDGGSGLYL